MFQMHLLSSFARLNFLSNSFAVVFSLFDHNNYSMCVNQVYFQHTLPFLKKILLAFWFTFCELLCLYSFFVGLLALYLGFRTSSYISCCSIRSFWFVLWISFFWQISISLSYKVSSGQKQSFSKGNFKI